MSEKEKAPQEIDLIELFSRMGSSIGNLFSSLFNLITKIVLSIFNAAVISLKFGLKQLCI
mgnify:CR=1 FL=1